MVELPEWSNAILMDACLYEQDCRTPHEECSGDQEDGESDVSEASYEAWVVGRSLYWRDHPEDETDVTHSIPMSNREPEDWDAELMEDENPYDADDLVGLCDLISSIGGSQWGSEDSYEPSLHHAPSIEWSREDISSTGHIVVGQFEDAEQ